MRRFETILRGVVAGWLLALLAGPAAAELWDEVTHGYADNNGVRIHYVTVGKGPLVVMIHGFPDFWYTWRDQMQALRGDFQVVAMDQRGYNRSDAPKGVASYAMPLLIGDVAAVIGAVGADRATIVGHDWGGAVAWQFAFALPQMTERLIVLNLPHPNGMMRELMSNPDQRRNSDYARVFREGSPDDPNIMFGGPMNVDTLSSWVRDPAARARYREAFGRSSFAGMLNFYKANYPQLPDPGGPPPPLAPRLGMPVLVFHGLKDRALSSDGLNNTWDWVDADTTIVTAPKADHFVQADASELVSKTMFWWLKSRL